MVSGGEDEVPGAAANHVFRAFEPEPDPGRIGAGRHGEVVLEPPAAAVPRHGDAGVHLVVSDRGERRNPGAPLLSVSPDERARPAGQSERPSPRAPGSPAKARRRTARIRPAGRRRNKRGPIRGEKERPARSGREPVVAAGREHDRKNRVSRTGGAGAGRDFRAEHQNERRIPQISAEQNVYARNPRFGVVKRPMSGNTREGRRGEPEPGRERCRVLVDRGGRDPAAARIRVVGTGQRARGRCSRWCGTPKKFPPGTEPPSTNWWLPHAWSLPAAPPLPAGATCGRNPKG